MPRHGRGDGRRHDVGNVAAANVTVDGTLSATSALINVPPVHAPDTFNIIPSTTTPITVTGGEATDTLTLTLTPPAWP